MDKIPVFDDIDDFDIISPKEISDEDAISKFCIAILDTNDKNIGSGVIITPQGIFVSVAHNFKMSDVAIDYGAFYNNQHYEIEILYKEYEFGKTDLVIGCLKNFIPTEVDIDQYPLLIPCEHLSVGDKVIISGFKSLELPDAEILENFTFKPGRNLSKQRISKQIPKPDVSQEIVLKGYEGNAQVYMEREGAEKYEGFSGGPVYDDQNLYGIVISHFFLKSSYIYCKLLELGIFKQ